MKGSRVLVVEDNDTLRRGITRALEEAGAQVDAAARGEQALAELRDSAAQPYDAVVTDLRLPGAGGLEVLDAAKMREPRTAVVMMTAYGSVETAVEAMRRGAFDFIQKPFDLEQLELRLGRALEHHRLEREVSNLRAERATRFGRTNLVGRSPALREALTLARRVAPSPSTVLVTGETGTGKELIAGLIHSRSPRSDRPFIKVNCAALPETLLESELFGHERGAFTGADRTRVGRFEQAHGGTLFLDEVGDLAPPTQAKLLRVLQEREFHRLGGSRALRVDVRIVAATNQTLEEEIREGRFREDLFFRLNVIRLHLPPLRERPDDAEELARHFAAAFARELGRRPRPLSRAAVEQVRAHEWPGNVRELRNVLERAVLLSEGDEIQVSDLGLPEAPDTTRAPVAWPENLALDEMERNLVLTALQRSAWVQKDAAARLGISRRKLNYMIQRMGITHPSWRRNRDRGES